MRRRITTLIERAIVKNTNELERQRGGQLSKKRKTDIYGIRRRREEIVKQEDALYWKARHESEALEAQAKAIDRAARRPLAQAMANILTKHICDMDPSNMFLVALILAISILPFLSQQSAKADTYLHSQIIRLNTGNLTEYWNSDGQVSTNISNIPVRIVLGAANFTFADAKADGSDYDLFKSDNTTPLGKYTEWWDSANQTASIWTSVNATAWSTDSYIIAKWGNDGAIEKSNAHDVFASDPSLIAAYLPNAKTGMALTDLSGHGNNGVLEGAWIQAASSSGVGWSHPEYGIDGDTTTGAVITITNNTTSSYLYYHYASPVTTSSIRYWAYKSTAIIIEVYYSGSYHNIDAVQGNFNYFTTALSGNYTISDIRVAINNNTGGNDTVVLYEMQPYNLPQWSQNGAGGLTFNGVGGSVNITASSSLNNAIKTSFSRVTEISLGGGAAGRIWDKNAKKVLIATTVPYFQQNHTGINGIWYPPASTWVIGTEENLSVIYSANYSGLAADPLFVTTEGADLSTPNTNPTGNATSDSSNNLFIGSDVNKVNTFNGTIKAQFFWDESKSISWLNLFQKSFDGGIVTLCGSSAVASIATNTATNFVMGNDGFVTASWNSSVTDTGSSPFGFVGFQASAAFTPYISSGLTTANFSFSNYHEYIQYLNAVNLSDGTKFGVFGAVDNSTGISHFYGLWSTDGGYTWVDPTIILTAGIGYFYLDSGLNVSSNGTITLTYNRINDPNNLLSTSWFQNSYDRGHTWSAATQISMGGYTYQLFTLNNNGVTLRNGVELRGVGFAPTDNVCGVIKSIDNGGTWHLAGVVNGGSTYVDEPSVVELANGNVLLPMRSETGQILQATSNDDGDSFGSISETGMGEPNAPFTVVRASFTPNVLIAAHNSDNTTPLINVRSPLVMQLSTNDGVTWGTPLVLAQNGDLSATWAIRNDHPSISVNADGHTGMISWLNYDLRFTGMSARWYAFDLDYLGGTKTLPNMTGNMTTINKVLVDKDGTFQYRAKAVTSGNLTSYGDWKTATVTVPLSQMPTPVTGAVTNTHYQDIQSYATLHGSVSSMGTALSANTYLDWGYTPTFGHTETMAVIFAPGSQSKEIAVDSAKTVYYQFRVTIGSVAATGGVQSFISIAQVDNFASGTKNILQAIPIITWIALFVGGGIVTTKGFRSKQQGLMFGGILMLSSAIIMFSIPFEAIKSILSR